MKNRKFAALVLTTLALGTLAGCGKKDQPEQNQTQAEQSATESTEKADASSEAAEVKTIRVANAAMPKPYSYLGDDGEVTGYDIDVIKAVFDYLPEYDMELTVTEFPSILAGIDSSRYDIGINCLKYTAERAEKYLFSDPYLDDFSVVVVPESNTDINSLADLNGKSTIEVTGTVGGERMEDYNKRTGAGIEINYSDADYSVLLQELNDGKYDFMYLNRLTYEKYNEEFHYNLRTFELTDEEKNTYTDGVDTELTYIMASKTDDGQKLINRVNDAIAALKENGTLDQLAEKYFGSTEYVPE